MFARAYEHCRDLYATPPDARAVGHSVGHFCPSCRFGAGGEIVDWRLLTGVGVAFAAAVRCTIASLLGCKALRCSCFVDIAPLFYSQRSSLSCAEGTVGGDPSNPLESLPRPTTTSAGQVAYRRSSNPAFGLLCSSNLLHCSW